MCKFPIVVNRTTKTITVSRSFQIAAGNIGSAEYQEYLKMKEQYPNFQIEVSHKSRKKPEGIFGDLSYDGMKSFIKGQETDEKSREAVLKELEDMRNLYKGQRGA